MIDRERLDDLILKNDTNDWWQPDLFLTRTKHLLPSALEILSDPPTEAKNHNCFIYAFGLSDDLDLISQTNGFIYDTFIKKLILEQELKIIDDPQPGDLVVYQDLEHYPDLLTHMGVIQGDGSVVSKWAWGPLIKHKLWDVPASYGNTVFYVQAIQSQTAKLLLEKYKDFNHRNSM